MKRFLGWLASFFRADCEGNPWDGKHFFYQHGPNRKRCLWCDLEVKDVP